MTVATATPPDSHIRDVILSDGRTLRLRPPEASDQQAMLDFFMGLDDQSRYLRFHGVRRVEASLVAGMIGPDWSECGSLIGIVQTRGCERIVAVASYNRLRDRRVAEAAFAVATDLQGCGVGTRLLEELATAASRNAIDGFVAEVLASDDPMLRVFADSGFDVARTADGSEVHIQFPIAENQRYLEALDRRDHKAIDRSLVPFFQPRSIAVIGASARRGAVGGAIVRNLVAGGFTGALYPINRSGKPVAGHPAFRGVSEVNGPVDLALVCVPASNVIDASEEALAAGVPAICVISSGFADAGSAGIELQQRLLSLVRGHGARMIGPNCLGLASTATPCVNATFAPSGFAEGPISVSSQSGAVGLAVIDAITARGLGISSFVSIGNKADVSSNDLLEHWEDDEQTRVIALYLESFGNPQRFTRIARRVSGKKPIVAIKAGSTEPGERAAESHTAAVVGSDSAVNGLFRQAGVLRAHSLEELVDLTQALSTQPLPKGRRVAIVSNAGGLGIVCADACATNGLEVASLSSSTLERMRSPDAGLALHHASNPVDLGGTATAAAYAAAIPPLLSDHNVDAVIVIATPTAVASRSALVAATSRALAVTIDTKPVLVVITGGWSTKATQGLCCYRYPESAVRALAAMTDRADWLRRPAGRVRHAVVDRDHAEQLVAAAIRESETGWLDDETARELLKDFGVPIADRRVVYDPAQARSAAQRLTYPATIKSAAPGVSKDSRHVSTVDKLLAEASDIGYPVLFSPGVSPGTEILIGAFRDAMLGPVVTFGPGGDASAVIADAYVTPIPLTDTDADDLVACGRVGQLLASVDGLTESDRAALTDVVQRVGQLMTEIPEVRELDLNAVIIRPGSCTAVDVRVRVGLQHTRQQLKSW